MEGSKWNADVIKAAIMKAGIPLAISMAGLIWAKKIATRIKTSESFGSRDSDSCDEERMSSEVPDIPGFGEEILGLGGILQSLHDQEWKLEMEFLPNCELRDREDLLQLELALGRVEALSQEVLAMEAEHRRVAEIALVYDKVLEEMQCLKSESGEVQRTVKKLSREVTESNLRMEAREREILGIRSKLENERDAVKRMEGEVKELRSVLEQLQQENNGLRIKFSSVEESVLKVRKLYPFPASELNKKSKAMQKAAMLLLSSIINLSLVNVLR